MKIPETSRGWDGEPKPFEWDGSIKQETVVQGFVVDVTDTQAHFLVTHVLEGEEEVFDDFHRPYNTASTWSQWFMQLPGDYRSLHEITERVYENGRLPNVLDKVDLEDASTAIITGDTIHIHHSYLWGSDDQGRRFGIGQHEVCRLPVPNQRVEDFLVETDTRRQRLAKIMLRTLEHKEQLAMTEQERITPNEPFRPFTQDEYELVTWGGQEWLRAKRVFGAGPVEDHFVKVTARPAMFYLTDLQGQEHFTQGGEQLLTHNILPLGEGSEDDPLYEVSVRIESSTVFCPAVGEQQVELFVDGQRYEAFQDPEESSYHFINPGHHIAINGYRAEGVRFDTSILTEEQAEALARQRRHEHEIRTAGLYRSVANGEDLRETYEGIAAEAEIAVRALREEKARDNAIIASIPENPRTYTVSSGAALLVPRSMLDAIEVNFPGIE